MTGANVVFFLGGARSGKSRLAQELAEKLADSQTVAPVYLATGQPFDAEMTERIARHRADRGPRWRTVECPLNLPEAIGKEAVDGNVVLVDCLTLWVSNLLLSDVDIIQASDRLLSAIGNARCPLVIVSNEVGLGIVPDNALARRFRDEAGRLHQCVAAAADKVFFVAAGLSFSLK
ncbi:MAG: bifunctional adenosylcobinamide kinase/adenosylcobinamide-phosphate guanylyltransferase [Sphingomonas sp.]|uniref:bifunctional adenosylcobinamide kinase/adenosylcobinamide-phosphate guanylyltransferase n=1 Tax=Sphingomonas sp. TaxID=28214 RepID=UPI0025EA5762|nr:bifunctional adenosylcobinamide kinase/adenosylcobinamide-phosphate guanylyltransferase [Sphingomonas sp.]MBY0284962.1 bifunctional adenosylcobinamide kinase/adenosylcobinamide-phosphate guanylyltransferase [Sphingomonas sp.]